MKINEPVTQKEVKMRDGQILVSTTNLKGIITTANAEFIEISGFTESELINKNHNVVRHPDMPPEAFEWLWRDVASGTPWKAMVKNRCKNGDHYWVEANVTPVYKNGQIVEYLSVRQKPTDEQISEAEALYQKVRDGEATLLKKGLLEKINLIGRMNLGAKLGTAIGLLVLAIVSLAFFAATELNKDISLTENEQQGVEYLIPAKNMLTQLMLHRGAVNALLSGNATAESRLAGIHEVGETNASTLDQLISTDNNNLNLAENWQALRGGWDGLKSEATTMNSFMAEAAHNEVINQAIDLIGLISERSQLILDPETETDYLITVLTTHAPKVLNQLGSLRESVTGIAERGEMSDQQRIGVITSLEALRQSVDAMSSNLDNVLAISQDVEDFMGEDVTAFTRSAKAFISTVNAITVSADRQGDLFYVISDPSGIFSQGTEAIDFTSALYDKTAEELSILLQYRVDNLTVTTYIKFALAALVVVVALLVCFLVVNGILRNMRDSLEVFAQLGEGNFNNRIVLDRGDETGEALRGLQKMQTKLAADLDRVTEVANANSRIKIALDNVSSNVMVADPNRDIIYCNKSVEELFAMIEGDIRKDLPDFDANALVGSNIDDFHKDPSHQATMLDTFTDTHTAEVNIGGRVMRVVANPVIDDEGQRLGSVVEWTDRTAEVAIEREIEEVVEGALAGDLSRNLILEGKSGFFAILAERLNGMLEVLNSTFQDVNAVMGTLAQGDLNNSITSDYEGIFGEVKNNVNNTIDQLRDIVGEIRHSADEITTNSSEIAEGNNNLSSRTEQQAAALEQTASSMEELTATVLHNSENAKQANSLASSAQQEAARGGEVVSNAVAAMSEINDSSNKIAEIIGVIDEIAFQTNLLALNASVEAARAGEQGRGFAVVATEVRNLAQRSATAAKEIKELIQDSVSKVESGSALVNESGETLQEIVGGIKKVCDIVSEIAAASAEQSDGISQVNQAVSSMDELTQQNAALAEEASAASASMAERATDMARSMQFFRT